MITRDARRILAAMDTAMRNGDATAYNGLARFLKIQARIDSDAHAEMVFAKA